MLPEISLFIGDISNFISETRPLISDSPYFISELD